MPGRNTPLVTNEIYHLVNQGLNRQPTFTDKREYQRAIDGLKFYQFKSPPTRLSFFLKMSSDDKEILLTEMSRKNKKLIDIICYCFMPNHFHILVKQKNDNGVSRFMSNFQNSYTRYFNVKNNKKGPIFYNKFKAVRIESEDQLIHVTRYIHLNPYSSFIIKNITELKRYIWSSLPEYTGENLENICNKRIIIDLFKNKEEYAQFVFDQADYQRQLDVIKHLVLED